jgi:hypothetical protein
VRPILLALLLAGTPALGKDEPPTTSRQHARRKKSIHAGLAYLARQQMRDGSFGRTESGAIGVTSLCLLSFLAAGHQENRGKYGELLHRGVSYLLQHSERPSRKSSAFGDSGKPVGYIHRPGDSDSHMHGHGYATQVLILAYGTGRTGTARARELKRKIRHAVRVIEESQTVTGGWGYEPSNRTFHEGSVTVTVVQALRLARDAGFLVDKGVVKQGLKYLHQSQVANGSFSYSVVDVHRTSAALTAAALTALYGFAEYYSKTIEKGLQYLEESHRRALHEAWLFYGNYYTAQAFHQAGERHWRLWNRTMVPFILEIQHPEGYWDDRQLASSPRTFGRAYATAFSCLALSVSDGYLPLFQR